MLKLNDDSNRRDSNSQNRENLLVASIDKNGKIVYLNKECEKLSGYIKNELSDKQLDFLLPDRYSNEWEKILNSIKENKSGTNFILPWLTKDGQEIMTSWNIAPVDDNYETIGLVGKLIDNEAELVDFPEAIDQDDNSDTNAKENNTYLFKIGSKRVYVNKGNKKRETKNKPKNPPKKNRNKDDNFFKKYDSKNLAKNFENINQLMRSIEDLQEKNRKLEEEIKKIKDQKNTKNVFNEISKSFNEKMSFLFNCMGISKKREEFNEMKKTLEEKKQILNDLESQLNNNKKELNNDRKNYIEWRKKLELLEDDIELRREYVAFNEERIDNKLNSLEKIKETSEIKVEGDNKTNSQPDELIDTIPSAAAIIQRGILKEVNDDFTELVGFKNNEIIEKSFFDFIDPKGLSGIESYYLDRIKGENVTNYETVFLKSDNSSIPAEITIKPTNYNGEKAEIIIIKEIK